MDGDLISGCRNDFEFACLNRRMEPSFYNFWSKLTATVLIGGRGSPYIEVGAMLLTHEKEFIVFGWNS